jgi:pSer/pThr/pTyr-binding forkhead associated (FHA) protein/acyl-CoA hydrolase
LARLVVKFRDGTLREVELHSVLSLGRQSTNDIAIPEDLASRQHARVIPSGRTFIIEDLRSANGTFVNGQRLQRRVLADGDLIRIGGCELVFRDDVPKDLIGELIADRYRVLGKLGSGGMGTVYRALQISMDRQVALKVLKPELTRDREFVLGFLNEARTAGQLNHPNIIQVHDFGEFRGYYYFSMEMVDGETVLGVLKREGKLDPRRSLTWMGQLCDALAHAHGHNIVHQDIKPQNLLLDRRTRDTVKLADLGLARVIGKDKGQQRGILMGTPHYMAPEQARGLAVDGRTDIYAAGATLFHMLTGRVPYDGRNSIEILTRHVKNEVPDPRQFDVSIPEAVANLVVQMMAKDPAGRPQTARDVAARISEILEHEKARLQKPAAQQRPAAAGTAQVAGRRQLRTAVRERRASAGVMPWILVGLLVAALIAVWILRDVFSPPAGQGGPGPGGRPGVGTPGGRTEQAELDARFDRARVLAEAGSYEDAQRLLAEIAALATGSETERRAEAELARLGRFRDARAELDGIRRLLARHPGQLAEARRRLELLIGRYADWPQLAEARSELERVAAAISGAASNSGTQQAADRERRAREELDKLRDSVRGLEKRQEFFVAERALLDFAAMHTGTRAADEAKLEAKNFREVGSEYMKGLMSRAAGLVARKQFARASDLYSQVIAADPVGEWGQRAREALTAQDTATRSAYEAGHARAMDAFRACQYREAARLAAAAAQEVTGTRWQNDLDRLAADANLCGRLHAAMVQVIAGHGGEMASPFRIETPDGTRAGRIVGASSTALEVRAGPALFPLKWKDIAPANLATVFMSYKVPAEHHLAAGILFFRLGLKNEAMQELRRAREVKETRAEAELRLAELEGRANLLTYDFSGGMQMLDWLAASGTWGIANGELAGGGPGESTVELAKAGYSARGLVLVFDLRQTGNGVFTAGLFGADDSYLGITVDPEREIAVVCSIGGAPLSHSSGLKLATGRKHSVRLEVSPAGLAVTIDGQSLPVLAAPRIEALSGNVRFKVLDSQVALDNIEIRNAAK